MPLNMMSLFPFCIVELDAGQSATWSDRTGWLQFATLQDVMDLWYFAKTWDADIDAVCHAEAQELSWNGSEYVLVGPVTRDSTAPKTFTLSPATMTMVEEFACTNPIQFSGSDSDTDFDYSIDLQFGVIAPITGLGDYQIAFDTVDSSYWLSYSFTYRVAASAALYALWQPYAFEGSTFFVGPTAYFLNSMEAEWRSPQVIADDGDVDIYGYTVDVEDIFPYPGTSWTSGTIDVATSWTY